MTAIRTALRVHPGGRPPARARSRRAEQFDRLPYLDDRRARRFVASHPDGATLEEVGVFLGVTRERVRQIEFSAVQRMRRECERLGIEASEVLAALAAKPSARADEHSPGHTSYASTEDRKRPDDPLPEELYSPRGRRATAALAEAEEQVRFCALLCSGREET